MVTHRYVVSCLEPTQQKQTLTHVSLISYTACHVVQESAIKPDQCGLHLSATTSATECSYCRHCTKCSTFIDIKFCHQIRSHNFNRHQFRPHTFRSHKRFVGAKKTRGGWSATRSAPIQYKRVAGKSKNGEGWVESNKKCPDPNTNLLTYLSELLFWFVAGVLLVGRRRCFWLAAGVLLVRLAAVLFLFGDSRLFV